MFAPAFFGVRHFAPRHFAPGRDIPVIDPPSQSGGGSGGYNSGIAYPNRPSLLRDKEKNDDVREHNRRVLMACFKSLMEQIDNG